MINQCRTIRLPIHVAKAINRYMRVTRELHQSPGRAATLDQIAAKLDFSPAEIERTQHFNERATSVDIPISREGEGTVLRLIIDAGIPEPVAAVAEIHPHIERSLNELGAGQQDVLMSAMLEQMGAELGGTRERVRRLRRMLETEGLDVETLFSH